MQWDWGQGLGFINNPEGCSKILSEKSVKKVTITSESWLNIGHREMWAIIDKCVHTLININRPWGRWVLASVVWFNNFCKGTLALNSD